MNNRLLNLLLKQLKPRLSEYCIGMILGLVLVLLTVYAIQQKLYLKLPIQYALNTPLDKYIVDEWQINKLRELNDRETLHVILTGGSAIQNGFLDTTALSKRLTKKLNYPIRVVNLAAATQNYAHVFSIVESLGNTVNVGGRFTQSF